MNKVLATAIREFKSTAMTRAFVFGVVLFPLLIIAGITIISALDLLASNKAAIVGTIAVHDLTEDRVIVRGLEEEFDPEKLRAEAEARRAAMRARLEEVSPDLANDPAAEMALQWFGREVEISVRQLAGDADLDAEKDKVLSGELLALVSVAHDAIQPAGMTLTLESVLAGSNDQEQAEDTTSASAAGSEEPQVGPFNLFHPPGKDVEFFSRVERSIERMIVKERYKRIGLDYNSMQALEAGARGRTITVTEHGEQETNKELTILIPGAFMLLLWISVMSGGQYLLMSTIEEKSSRVMEVLLSAISPLQLMIGKMIGQGVVGLAILGIYAGIGVVAARQFNVLALIPMDSLPWLALYFLMAYAFFAALMAAIGSAVTEIREAQSLMGPVMTLLMFPIFLWFPIIDNPNSTFSQVASFIPPVTPFVMILRVSQTSDPVPTWEIIGATIVGFAGVLVTVWAAVKIFRIGVLMYGKPPSFMGLVKMLRYA